MTSSASGPALTSVLELVYMRTPAVPMKTTRITRATRILKQDFILEGILRDEIACVETYHAVLYQTRSMRAA